MALWKTSVDGGHRFARGAADRGPEEFLPASVDLDEILSHPAGGLEDVLAAPTEGAVPAGTEGAGASGEPGGVGGRGDLSSQPGRSDARIDRPGSLRPRVRRRSA